MNFPVECDMMLQKGTKGGAAMRRFGALLLLTIALLAGCGGRESPVSPDEAPETALTEQDVINMVYRRVGGIRLV